MFSGGIERGQWHVCCGKLFSEESQKISHFYGKAPLTGWGLLFHNEIQFQKYNY